MADPCGIHNGADGRLAGSGGGGAGWQFPPPRAAPPLPREGRPPAPVLPPRLNAAAVSPDGRLVAAGYNYDGKDPIPLIRLWDPSTGKEVLSITGPKWAVNYLAFTPDGKYLLSGGAVDGAFRLWDVKTGEAVRAFAEDEFQPYGGGLSADGKLLLTLGIKHTGQQWQHDETWKDQWKLWEVETGKLLRTVPLRGSSSPFVPYLPITPDAKRVVFGGNLLDVESGKSIRSFSRQGFCGLGALSPDGKRLVLDIGEPVGPDATQAKSHLELWNLDDEPAVVGPKADGDKVLPEPGDQEVDKQPRQFPTRGPGISELCGGSRGYARLLVFSPDGKGILTADADGMLRFWDVASAKETWEVEVGDCRAAAFIPNGKELLVVCEVREAGGPGRGEPGPGRLTFRFLGAVGGKLLREP